MLPDFATTRLNKGWKQVNALNEMFIYCASRGIGATTWIIDDQRHLDRLLVEHVLFPHPMITQIITVIGGKNNHRIIQQSLGLEKGHQKTHLIIDLFDQAHIGWQDMVAHTIT